MAYSVWRTVSPADKPDGMITDMGERCLSMPMVMNSGDGSNNN